MSTNVLLIIILAAVVLGFVLVILALRLVAKMIDHHHHHTKFPFPPQRICASCGNPAGADPVVVNDMLAALVNRPEIKIRYYVCQPCAGVS